MAVLQVIGIIVLSLFNYMVVIGPYGMERFKKEIWFMKQSNETVSYCFRGYLANDVSNRLITENMTRREVIALLGEPGRSEKMEIEYNLGYCSMLDDNGMIVKFDARGKVQDVECVQH